MDYHSAIVASVNSASSEAGGGHLSARVVGSSSLSRDGVLCRRCIAARNFVLLVDTVGLLHSSRVVASGLDS